MQKQTVPMPTAPPTESLGMGDRNRYSTTPETSQNLAAAKNWSPGLQHVLDQPPRAFPSYLLLGGMVFCLVFSTWAWLGKIEEVGHARGKLVPQGEVYKVHPVESGKVAGIAVKEGDRIKAGHVLVELDNQIANSEVERLQQLLAAYQFELSQKQGLIARTRVEAGTRKAIAAANLKAHSSAIAAAREKAANTKELLKQLHSEVAASNTRLERLQPLLATSQERQRQMRTDVAENQARIKRLKPLVEKGAISKELLFQAEQNLRDRTQAITQNQLEEGTNTKERLFEAEQALRERTKAITQNEGELKQALVEVERLQAGLAQKQAEARTTQLEAEQQIQQLEVELTEAKAKMAETGNLLTSATAKLKQRFLYATVDGVVSSLNIHNIGEVVQPGQTIAEIAPATAPLILSASLPNKEAGFVKTGMPVQVKLDAYPYQNYGMVTGKVTSISPDAKQDERLGAVYRVEVALDRSYITANHQIIQFKAGQTASAEIIIRQRRIADILLDPIQQLQKGGINL